MSDYAGVRVVVLGAAGFIGRWVARKLSDAGAALYLAVRDGAKAESIFAAYGISGELVAANLADAAAAGELLRRTRPAVVFNMAGYGVDRGERDEGLFHQINHRLVQAVYAAMSTIPGGGWTGQRVVHAGSALEYGNIGGNLAEDSIPNPDTLYGKSKLAGTMALAEHCSASGLRGLTARLFTVYGPGEHEGRLLPALLVAAASRTPLELTAGKQRRDFTYVEDVAEGLLRLGLCAAKPGEVVNLATGRLTSVREFAETAAAVLNIPQENLRFGAIPTRPEEMQHDEVTIERLRRLTGWFPETDIPAGIRRTQAFVGGSNR